MYCSMEMFGRQKVKEEYSFFKKSFFYAQVHKTAIYACKFLQDNFAQDCSLLQGS